MKTFPSFFKTISCLLFMVTAYAASASAQAQNTVAVADTTVYYSSPYITNGSFASYPGGDIAFIRYLQLHMRPVDSFKIATVTNADDKVAEIYVNFQIEKDGTISDVRLSNDVDHATDVEMVRVFKHAVWRPATDNGKPVAGGYTLLVILEKTGTNSLAQSSSRLRE